MESISRRTEIQDPLRDLTGRIAAQGTGSRACQGCFSQLSAKLKPYGVESCHERHNQYVEQRARLIPFDSCRQRDCNCPISMFPDRHWHTCASNLFNALCLNLLRSITNHYS